MICLKQRNLKRKGDEKQQISWPITANPNPVWWKLFLDFLILEFDVLISNVCSGSAWLQELR